MFTLKWDVTCKGELFVWAEKKWPLLFHVNNASTDASEIWNLANWKIQKHKASWFPFFWSLARSIVQKQQIIVCTSPSLCTLHAQLAWSHSSFEIRLDRLIFWNRFIPFIYNNLTNRSFSVIGMVDRSYTLACCKDSMYHTWLSIVRNPQSIVSFSAFCISTALICVSLLTIAEPLPCKVAMCTISWPDGPIK